MYFHIHFVHAGAKQEVKNLLPSFLSGKVHTPQTTNKSNNNNLLHVMIDVPKVILDFPSVNFGGGQLHKNMNKNLTEQRFWSVQDR